MPNDNGASQSFRIPRFNTAGSTAQEENTTQVVAEVPADTTIPGQLVRRTVVRGTATDGSLRDELNDMRQMLARITERNTVEQRVFDTLHSELKDYKNDFFYERLKPIVRPLLFLHDSIEQLDCELAARETADEQLKRDVTENIQFLRTQLTEILAICEVTPITETRGRFDPAIHKAVESVQVAPEEDNTIQRVVRSGWYLNGTLLRPVEVVRGRA